MGRSSDGAREREWQRRLAQFERSGVSVVHFCRDEGVSAPSFYH